MTKPFLRILYLRTGTSFAENMQILGGFYK